MSRPRSGHLFQGPYKAILIEADAYAKQLSRYIHMNPVRAGVAEHPEEYQWSSCRYYTLEGKAPEWLEKGFILGYFGKKSAVSRKRYRDFMRSVMEPSVPGLPPARRLGRTAFRVNASRVCMDFPPQHPMSPDFEVETS